MEKDKEMPGFELMEQQIVKTIRDLGINDQEKIEEAKGEIIASVMLGMLIEAALSKTERNDY